MVEAISSQEEKRVSEFRTKYADKWFRYMVIGSEDDNPISRVIHIADSKKELLTASKEEFLTAGFTEFGIDWGVNVNPEPGIQIGGTCIHS